MNRRSGPLRQAALASALGLVGAVGLALPTEAASTRSQPTSLCIPIPFLLSCSVPSPSGTPSPSGLLPGVPGVPVTPSAPGRATTPPLPGASRVPVPASTTPAPTGPAVPVANSSSTVFTLPAAQLSGSSIQISGLQGVSLVTVPVSGGGTATVVKLKAADIVIDDFVLDVRSSTASARGVTTSARMELRGNVSCYLDSLSAQTSDGRGVTLGAQTPLPGSELPSSLLSLSVGLVGVEADSMSMTPSHLSVTAGTGG